jgi:hypothetical protein
MFSRLDIDDSTQELSRLFSALSLNGNFQASMHDLVNRFAKLDIQSEPMDEITSRFNALRNINYVTQLAEEFARLSL